MILHKGVQPRTFRGNEVDEKCRAEAGFGTTSMRVLTAGIRWREGTICADVTGTGVISMMASIHVFLNVCSSVMHPAE